MGPRAGGRAGERYDYAIIGSGLGGLLTGALLANAGARVCILERHYHPGGYAHSFKRGGYWFCAGLHYVFNSLPDEDGGLFLRALGLEDEIRFSPMADESFDILRFPSLAYSVRRGIHANAEALARRFPGCEDGLRRYYALLAALYLEAFQAPVSLPLRAFARHPLRYRHLLRHRNTTTGELMTRLGFPVELRDVLSGQCGNIGLPPSRSSLIAHAINVIAYDQGACYPTRSYFHMMRRIARAFRERPGCRLRLKEAVTRLEVARDRVIALTTARGRRVVADRFLFNGDPKLLPALIEGYRAPRWFRRKLGYEYSAASFTLYMGLRDVDLRAHGFGNWNVWHYPDHDLDAVYRRQLVDQDLSRPFLAITTPTLHASARAEIAPAGGEQMVICTWVGYERMARLRARDEAAYYREKQRVTDAILDTIEREYVPGIRARIEVLEAGSPTTNAFYCAAPAGNSYGASMTPAHVNLGTIRGQTPFRNLTLVGASSGMPGLGGGFRNALSTYAELTGDDALTAALTRRRALRYLERGA
ncbi:MAG: NAD(P)/FAD-dependent oxidoreductase [Myxococcales bacterium]|nr:NAD(P)/FAD-dependent oxidoreductase [Myxococcales bacterium]